MDDSVRTSPSSIEAEHGILSSAFLDPRRTMEACHKAGIRPEHFYHPANGVVFNLLLDFWMENEPIETLTFIQVLRDQKRLNDCAGQIRGQHCSGIAFISELATLLPTAANVGRYVEIVQEKYTLREFIRTFTDYAAKGYAEQDDVPALLSSAVEAVMKLVKLGEGRKINTRTTAELAERFMQGVDRRIRGEWKVEMPTGLRELDKMTLGFEAPLVTSIIGKPSDGKSSLAMNIAEHLAFVRGKRGGIISLDDSDDQVTTRFIQQMSRINMFEFKRTGDLGYGEYEKLKESAAKFASARDRIFIRDDGALSPAEIEATFATWKTQHGLDYAIIDHIQLARGNGNTRGKTEEAEQVSRSLKPLAKRFGIPLIVLSQVTEDKHNAGSYSTKNSKALEEDSNNVWAISRSKDTTDAFINISKQKDGPRDVSVPVSYLAYCTRFTDREPAFAEQSELVHMHDPKKKTGQRK